MANSYPMYICCCYDGNALLERTRKLSQETQGTPLSLSGLNEMGIKQVASLIPQDHSENHKK